MASACKRGELSGMHLGAISHTFPSEVDDAHSATGTGRGCLWSLPATPAASLRRRSGGSAGPHQEPELVLWQEGEMEPPLALGQELWQAC